MVPVRAGLRRGIDLCLQVRPIGMEHRFLFHPVFFVPFAGNRAIGRAEEGARLRAAVVGGVTAREDAGFFHVDDADGRAGDCIG